jgi:hypothetical protein
VNYIFLSRVFYRGEHKGQSRFRSSFLLPKIMHLLELQLRSIVYKIFYCKIRYKNSTGLVKDFFIAVRKKTNFKGIGYDFIVPILYCLQLGFVTG